MKRLIEGSTIVQAQDRKKTFSLIGAVMLLGLGALGIAGSEPSVALMPAVSERVVASLAFPRFRETSDTDDILREYPAYLNFVLEVGRDVNPPLAQRLSHTYHELRRRSPDGAARFLRGLRFEMVYRLELTGASPASVNTRTPEMRRWVNHYLNDWWREADEGLFRSYVVRR